MKKVHLLMTAKDVEESLQALRTLGVLHLEHSQEPRGESLAVLQQQMTQVEKALVAIEKYVTPKTPQKKADVEKVASQIHSFLSQKQEADEQINKLSLGIEQWSVWGDFDPQGIQDLRAQGCFVYFFEGEEKELKILPDHVTIEIIKQVGKKVYAMIVSFVACTSTSLIHVLPPMSVSAMKQELEAQQKKITDCEEQLAKSAVYHQVLQQAMKVYHHQMLFEQARHGMVTHQQIAEIKGFCPADVMPALHQYVQEQGWGIMEQDPSDEDQVPTLTKNPAWVNIINPVFDFMSILPGYREADVSSCFLIFFSIFFGIIVGDAGYGFIFLLITILAHQKFASQSNQSIFHLMYVLSGCTILWGLATGTFLGTELFGSFLKPFVPWLNQEINFKSLCFIIGVTHLTIAHVWRGLRKLPSLAAVGEIGWILLLWSAYFLCGQIILERPIPVFMMPMLYAGIAIVVLFNRPEKNILITILNGLGDLLLGIMNVFIDLISYIRLFAVAAASVALANSFNAAVTSIGFHHILAGLGTALILVMGHTLNIVLSLMAVLVHGLRLNILEFSGHQGLEWLGIKYEPLKKA